MVDDSNNVSDGFEVITKLTFAGANTAVRLYLGQPLDLLSLVLCVCVCPNLDIRANM